MTLTQEQLKWETIAPGLNRLPFAQGWILNAGGSNITYVPDPSAPHVIKKALVEHRNAEASDLFVKAYTQASNCRPVDWLRVAARMNDLLQGRVDDET